MGYGAEPAGLFVTLEGGEGAGKSTLIAALAEALGAMGHEVVLTREPGGSPLAERTRALLLQGAFRGAGPEAEAVVFALARSDHLSKTIVPALARGAIVLCDRFFDSTRAYQGASGGVGDGILDALEREAAGGWRPGLTLVLDLPVEVGHARATARRGAAGADRFEGEGLAFHEAVRAGFLRVAEREPGRCVVVDATMGADEVLRVSLGHLVGRIPDAGPAPGGMEP